MQWLFLIVAVVWVVIGAAGNKKKQQARAEAEKQAAEQRAQQPAARPAAPASPYYPDVPPKAQPVQPPKAQPVRQAQPVQKSQPVPLKAAPVAAPMQAPVSSLTELRQTQRHTLTPSGSTGHAHQETSMSGFEPDCPPETPTAHAAEQAPAPYAGMPAFSWNPNAVLNGMVYAEILSKPKALRG